MESILLAASLADRGAFEQIEEYGGLADFSDQGQKVCEEVRKYYQADAEARAVDRDIILRRLHEAYPADKHKDIFTVIINNLAQEVSVPNVLLELSAIRKSNLKDDIRSCLEGGNEEKLTELFGAYQKCVENQATTHEKPTLVVNRDITDILKQASSAAAIQLSPPSLNATLDGGLLRGHHLLFFARPDCGKTTFAIEQIYGFLKQGLKVLYLGNEDPRDDVLYRLWTRLTHMTKEKIQSNPVKAKELAIKRNYGNFTFGELFPGTLREIEEAVELVRPDVLIVDQVRNLNTKVNNRVEELEVVERFIRNLGKKYEMVTISLTQAGDSADGKLILGMGDVDWSNTGMQAAADVIIGMGVDFDYEQSGRRMLSFPKNKRSRLKDPIQVQFDGRYNRIH